MSYKVLQPLNNINLFVQLQVLQVHVQTMKRSYFLSLWLSCSSTSAITVSRLSMLGMPNWNMAVREGNTHWRDMMQVLEMQWARRVVSMHLKWGCCLLLNAVTQCPHAAQSSYKYLEIQYVYCIFNSIQFYWFHILTQGIYIKMWREVHSESQGLELLYW